VVATTLGGLCYYQYQQINQVKQQIEKKNENKVFPPKVKKPSLSLFMQDVVNVIEGGKTSISLELEQLMTRLEKDKSSTNDKLNNVKVQLNEANKRAGKLEEENNSLEKERDELQSKVNEFEKYTYVNFCNKTSGKEISAALAYWDGKGLRSRGWWNIKPGKCTEISLDQNYRGNLYIYGMSDGGKSSWVSGNTLFCVDIVNAFEIKNSDKVSCSEGNLRKVIMSEATVSPGRNNWNFNEIIPPD
jgi:uncharacterized membrane protein